MLTFLMGIQIISTARTWFLDNLSLNSIIDSYTNFLLKIGDIIYLFYFEHSRDILNWLHNFFKTSFDIFLALMIALGVIYLLMSLLVLFRKKEKEKKLVKGSEPYVTIQIPTYNELAALNCAKRCLDFDYPAEKVQIIIGDDSSDKDVSRQIDTFAKKYEGRILVTRRGGNEGYKPGNLNHMLKYTTGEIIVLFDSDFLPEKDFLRRIVAPYTYDDGISVVQARWNIYNYSKNIYSVMGGTISLMTHHVVLPFVKLYGGSTFLCGSAESIRKKDLEEVGGWRMGSLTEDIECSMRLIKRGKRLLYLENLDCRCEAPYTFRDLCKQQMRWAYGVITAMKLHLWDVMKSKATNTKDKIAALIFSSGYMFTLLILLLTIFGILSVISAEPAPIDWPKFISETLINIALTSGFLIASAVSLVIAGKIREIPRMLYSSLSIGIVLTFHVNRGIFRAINERGMQWFILKKMGNRLEK